MSGPYTMYVATGCYAEHPPVSKHSFIEITPLLPGSSVYISDVTIQAMAAGKIPAKIMQSLCEHPKGKKNIEETEAGELL